MKIEIYDSQTLGKATKFIDGIQRGMADQALTFPPYNSATFPLFNDQFLPFLYRDYKGQLDAFNNGVTDLYMEELKSKGMDKIGTFGATTTGARYLMGKRIALR